MSYLCWNCVSGGCKFRLFPIGGACSHYQERQAVTKYDAVVRMTPEELAELLEKVERSVVARTWLYDDDQSGFYYEPEEKREYYIKEDADERT